MNKALIRMEKGVESRKSKVEGKIRALGPRPIRLRAVFGREVAWIQNIKLSRILVL
jgi:hypothetical protein